MGDHPTARDIHHRHEFLGEGQERAGASIRLTDVQEIAAAVVRHLDDRAEHLPRLVLDAQADEIGKQELVLVIGGAEPVEALDERLTSLGITIEEGPVPRTGARARLRSIYLRDPDGNLVEIANEVAV